MTNPGEKIFLDRKREGKNPFSYLCYTTGVFVLKAVGAKLHRGPGNWANGSLQSSQPQQAESAVPGLPLKFQNRTLELQDMRRRVPFWAADLKGGSR